VPIGNPSGWSDTETLSGLTGNSILNLTVGLQISGGYNGDLYAYLSDGSGFCVLLNRVGATSGNPFGYGDSGLNVTFSDSASNGDIHNYQNVPGYAASIANGSAWQPDGRTASPFTAVDTDPRSAFLSSFDGQNPNGPWTLFVADLSLGAASTVESWGLTIETANAGGSVSDGSDTAFLLALATACLFIGRRKIRQPARFF
jgi:subtilisin-like proprotein convertase family protein